MSIKVTLAEAIRSDFKWNSKSLFEISYRGVHLLPWKKDLSSKFNPGHLELPIFTKCDHDNIDYIIMIITKIITTIHDHHRAAMCRISKRCRPGSLSYLVSGAKHNRLSLPHLLCNLCNNVYCVLAMHIFHVRLHNRFYSGFCAQCNWLHCAIPRRETEKEGNYCVRAIAYLSLRRMWHIVCRLWKALQL